MNEKKLQKGFFFGYGQKSFGEDNTLFENCLTADLSCNEGCGIALIANKHINFKEVKSKIILNIGNFSVSDAYVRIEKKFSNNIKTGFEKVDAGTLKKVALSLDLEDRQMNELVVAILREDNKEETYSISLNVELT